MKFYTDILAFAGYAFTEEDQILYILSGLGHEYDPVIVTLTSQPDVYSLRDRSALIQSFEMHLEPIISTTPINTDGSSPTAKRAFQPKKVSNSHSSTINNTRGSEVLAEGMEA